MQQQPDVCLTDTCAHTFPFRNSGDNAVYIISHRTDRDNHNYLDISDALASVCGDSPMCLRVINSPVVAGRKGV